MPVYRTGELMDLSISSYNNPFGKGKIDWMARDGVLFSVEKYISELEELLDHDPATKSGKRVERLELLRMVSQLDSASLIFKRLTGYMNGCYASDSSRLDGQSVVVIVTGGNLYVIFAGLMLDAITSEEGLEVLSEMCEIDLEELRWLQSAAPSNPGRTPYQESWFAALVVVADQGFSDLDFCMVPGKNSAEEYRQRGYEWDGYQSGYEENNSSAESSDSAVSESDYADDDDAGFVLLRMKTSQKVTRSWRPPSNAGCWNLAARLRRADLEPEGPFQLRNLEAYFATNPPRGDKDTRDCFSYLQYLQFLRHDSDEQTQFNIETLSEILDEDDNAVEDSSFANMANYLHEVTDAMNRQIVSLITKPARPSRRYIISDQAFDSLSTILSDRSLVFLGAKLLDFYANFPTTRVEDLTNAIHMQTGENQIASVFRPPSANAQAIVNAEHVLYTRMTDNLGFVDGLRVTVNAVETNSSPSIVEEGDSENLRAMFDDLALE